MTKASLQGPPRPASSASSSLITPETLSKVDWYSRRPAQGRVPCYNSDADDGNHASEAEDTEHEGGTDMKEVLHARRGLKEGQGEGAGIPGQGHPPLFLRPSLPLPFAGEKPSIAASKDANKVERPPPHTYPGGAIPWSEAKKVERPPPHTYSGGAIPLSGNILPHSGLLLPHHYKNKQHSGAHSGAGAHAHKGLLPSKGVSLIPSLVSCQSMKGRRALDGEIEPSSPKVTCLGRIKIKQRCQHEAGKVSEAAAYWQLGKKGVRNGVASTQDRDEGPVRAALSPSTPPKADLRKSIHWGHKKDTRTTDRTLDAEAKAKKSMHKALADSKYLLKFHRERDRYLSSDAPVEFTGSCAESAIDLGRFPSERSGQMRDLTKASTSFPTVGDLDSCGSGFVPQVPPANSLMLMRNSKSRAACMVLSSSSMSEHGVTSTKMFDERGDVPTESKHDEETVGFLGSDVKCLSAVELEGVDRTLGREMAVADQASLHPKADSEARLWQRRCIVRPMELDVGRPTAYS